MQADEKPAVTFWHSYPDSDINQLIHNIDIIPTMVIEIDQAN
jgi:hypothetical protein